MKIKNNETIKKHLDKRTVKKDDNLNKINKSKVLNKKEVLKDDGRYIIYYS